MKVILVAPDKSLFIGERPTPVPLPGEALIKVEAAAVNRADLMQRAGNYPPPPGAPDWLGLEAAGKIVAFGDETGSHGGFRTGDPVCALLGGGGYAEYIAAPVDMLMPVPDGFTIEEAAATPEAFATSYLNLVIEGDVRPGDRVLVTAGGSGLASAMIPMARALGASVCASVRHENKADAVRAIGADEVIVTSRESLPDALARMESDGRPVSLAIDCVGGPDVADCLPHLAQRGKWIMIATLAGDVAAIDLRKLYVKHTRLIGSTLRSRPIEMKCRIIRELRERILPIAAAHGLKPTIYRSFPFQAAEDAHAVMESNENVGKLVLTF